MQRGTQSNESPTLVWRDAGWGLKSRLVVRGRDRNTLRFEGGIRDGTGIDGIIIRLKLRFTDLRDIRKYQYALEMGLINAPV